MARPQDGQLTVRLFASLRDLFGEKEIQVAVDDAPDVAHLMSAICGSARRRHAILEESGAVRKEITVLVNGRNFAFLGGMGAALQAGDEVAVFPPMYGG